MSKVGLHGKVFIPLLSSFACAIPGIMATRTIGDRKARLITILVAPLMSCSARLPVYLLMTSAFIPNRPVLRIGHLTLLTLPGVTFVAMYFLGMIAAFCMAWLFHRTLLKGVAPDVFDGTAAVPPAVCATAVLQMVERAWLFVKRARNDHSGGFGRGLVFVHLPEASDAMSDGSGSWPIRTSGKSGM